MDFSKARKLTNLLGIYKERKKKEERREREKRKGES